jgi:alkanesulfonate monooxygenase SsuD/methylene tetrahydromethanopterin reductase-like flavin-dependent oxidoreductase (luciferase family)
MRVSINVTAFPASDPAGHLTRVVEAAEESGIDTVWVGDHVLQVAPGLAPTDPMLEACTTLGFLAARTSRVRLGTMVAGATFRAPALLVKAVGTLDALTGGRAWLGVGAGYNETEDLDLSHRFERLEEVVRLARDNDFHPVSRPPILIGGAGERRTLRLVARYADACNLFDIPDGGRTVRRKLDVLARHCEEAGRDFGAIEKTISTRTVDPERFAELGIAHAVVITDGPWTQDAIARLTQ